MDLQFLLSAHFLKVLYIFSKFGKKEGEGIFLFKMWMEKLSWGSNMKVEWAFLFSAHRLMMLYICSKFHENIFDGSKVIE